MNDSQVTRDINETGGLWSALNSGAGEVERTIVESDLQKIRTFGYIPDETQMAFLPSRTQRVYSWGGSKTTTPNRASHQRIFFFLDNRYLGTDTKYSHDMVTIYPSAKNTITAAYEGNSDFLVHFTWSGGYITPDRSFTTYHSWYND